MMPNCHKGRRSPFLLEQVGKRWKQLIIILLILNIILPTSVIVLVKCRQWSSTYTLYSESQNQDGTFRRNLDEVYNTVEKELDLAITQPQIQADTRDTKLEVLNLLKPVCQLSGLDFDDNKRDNRNRDRPRIIRNWADNKGSERHLLWNGMRHENGSVSVPVTGVYHFHSHVKFYVENNKKDKSIRHFQHNIVRYDALTGKQKVVASSKVSECTEGINEGAHLEYPNDLDCVVQLNEGDQLSVEVSGFDLLKHDRDWHNFGGYLI